MTTPGRACYEAMVGRRLTPRLRFCPYPPSHGRDKGLICRWFLQLTDFVPTPKINVDYGCLNVYINTLIGVLVETRKTGPHETETV
jgi:hypothetical protein